MLYHLHKRSYFKEGTDMDKLKQFGYQMQSRMAQFLYGRNGFDNLARACNAVAILLLVINIFAQNAVLYFLWMVFFTYSVFRVYSRNIPKRYAENQKFLAMMDVPQKRIRLLKLQWRDRSVSRYYICKSCHQQIRVPKGKGRIEIRCPKCGERFIKKT
jgi:DNA-directed RNA polymerase subunit RPC12/RpoP